MGAGTLAGCPSPSGTAPTAQHEPPARQRTRCQTSLSNYRRNTNNKMNCIQQHKRMAKRCLYLHEEARRDRLPDVRVVRLVLEGSRHKPDVQTCTDAHLVCVWGGGPKRAPLKKNDRDAWQQPAPKRPSSNELYSINPCACSTSTAKYCLPIWASPAGCARCPQTSMPGS